MFGLLNIIKTLRLQDDNIPSLVRPILDQIVCRKRKELILGIVKYLYCIYIEIAVD